MDSQDHTNTQHSPGGKSHVCTKCGWSYPNPHPSAKNRRAHKKICGTIKGFEILDSEKAKQDLDLQEEHCLDDNQKLPSPKVDERIGDVSEEDVFADAVCEFSSSISFKEKELTATICMAKSAKIPDETQQCNKSSQVIQESCEVPPVEVLENFTSSVEAASEDRQGGEPSSEGQNMEFETGNDSSAASALGKRKDTFDSSWNDEVIYSDVEGPHGFDFEADYTVSENVLVDTSYVKANVISASPSVRDGPFAENADVSLHGTKGLQEFESNHSLNPETPKGEECETDTLTQTKNLGIQPEGLSIGTEVPSSDKVPLKDQAEPQGQTCLVAVREFPSAENIVMSKIAPEDINMKDEEGVLSLTSAQETLETETSRASLSAVDPIVADSNADVSHAGNKTGLVDLIGQANVVAEDKSPISNLSSESSCAVEHYVSPVSVVLEGDDPSDQNKSLTETSKDSILQIGAEDCKSNDEDCRESSKREVLDESNTRDDSANQKLLESGRTEFNRVVGGLGVIQANEIDGDVKAHNYYAEVPVTIESNDHRDFGRLQNLSEAQIRSLVSSPLVTRDNTSNAFGSNLGSISGLSDGVNKPENESQSSSLAVALSKNQEITLEKTTSWSTVKEQHVPLKNLLNEARSPRLLAAEAKKDHESNIPRVSSILDQETSPEDGRWPERREASEEWNSPAKYPVDLKREERKVKGRPFWVPFVCCSSVK